MNKFCFSFLVLMSTCAFSQTSWKIQVDTTFKVWGGYGKIVSCVDGGIAVAGIDNSTNSFIYKTDSVGNYQWSKYYYQNFTDPAPYEAIQLRATSDTGFYLLTEDELDMFGWFSTPLLQKIDKDGMVTGSIGMGYTGSWGNNLYLGAVEKYNSNLYGLGAGSSYDPVDDDICCYQGYSFKLDSSLNLIRKIGYDYLFYDSLDVPFNAFNTLDTNNHWTGFELYDTSGYHFSTIQYTIDTIQGVSRYPRAYCQDNDNYYFIVPIDKNFYTKPCILKVDKNFKTSFAIVLDTSNVLPFMNYWREIKIDKSAEGNILFSVLLSYSYGKTYPFMMEMDTSGNILSAYKGNGSDSAYVSCAIDTITESCLFLSRNKLYNNSPLILQREFLSSPSCGFIPLTFYPVPLTVIDSVFIASDTLVEGNEPNSWSGSVPETNFSLLPGFPICGVLSGNSPDQKGSCIPTIYPNPASDKINISFDCEMYQNTEVKIYNSIGSEISSKVISLTSDELIFDVSELPAGIYLAKFQRTDRSLFSSKIIIQD